ncbi:unnamed protein product [Urochloa humidicola]
MEETGIWVRALVCAGGGAALQACSPRSQVASRATSSHGAGAERCTSSKRGSRVCWQRRMDAVPTRRSYRRVCTDGSLHTVSTEFSSCAAALGLAPPPSLLAFCADDQPCLWEGRV